jgi:hypothetical protein
MKTNLKKFLKAVKNFIAEKLSALTMDDYLSEREKRGSRAKFEAALAKVPDVEPDPVDRL